MPARTSTSVAYEARSDVEIESQDASFDDKVRIFERQLEDALTRRDTDRVAELGVHVCNRKASDQTRCAALSQVFVDHVSRDHELSTSLGTLVKILQEIAGSRNSPARKTAKETYFYVADRWGQGICHAIGLNSTTHNSRYLKKCAKKWGDFKRDFVPVANVILFQRHMAALTGDASKPDKAFVQPEFHFRGNDWKDAAAFASGVGTYSEYLNLEYRPEIEHRIETWIRDKDGSCAIDERRLLRDVFPDHWEQWGLTKDYFGLLVRRPVRSNGVPPGTPIQEPRSSVFNHPLGRAAYTSPQEGACVLKRRYSALQAQPQESVTVRACNSDSEPAASLVAQATSEKENEPEKRGLPTRIKVETRTRSGRTRSGRKVTPPAEFWRGEGDVYQHGKKVGVRRVID